MKKLPAPLNRQEAIEGEVISASRAGYARRPSLGTARGVRKELSSVYLELRRGEISERHATAAAFLLRTILEAVRLDEIERRLVDLERRQT